MGNYEVREGEGGIGSNSGFGYRGHYIHTTKVKSNILLVDQKLIS